MWICVFCDCSLNARFNLDFSCASAITFCAVWKDCAHWCSVARVTLGQSDERREGNHPNTSPQGATPLSPGVSLQEFTTRLIKNSVFSFGWSIRGFRKLHFTGSYYSSTIPNALWCYVSDICHSMSWISQIYTKVSLNCESSSKINVFCSPVCTVSHRASMVFHLDSTVYGSRNWAALYFVASSTMCSTGAPYMHMESMYSLAMGRVFSTPNMSR